MKSLLGIKVGMTQVFDENGVVTPVTIVRAGPCYVTQVKSEETDGYSAIQVGFEETKDGRLSKAQRGHLGRLPKDKKHPNRKNDRGIPSLRHLKEMRIEDSSSYKVGQTLTVEEFAEGDFVDVTGKTKGRGFAGVVKRWGFAGGDKTHGQSDRWRAPGSIGATSGTAHVFKGKKMPGRMGNKGLTAQNLQIVRIDSDKNLLAIKGSVPGSKGSLVVVRTAVKKG